MFDGGGGRGGGGRRRRRRTRDGTRKTEPPQHNVGKKTRTVMWGINGGTVGCCWARVWPMLTVFARCCDNVVPMFGVHVAA